MSISAVKKGTNITSALSAVAAVIAVTAAGIVAKAEPGTVKMLVIAISGLSFLAVVSIFVKPVSLYYVWGLVLIAGMLWPGEYISARVGPGSGLPVEYIPLFAIFMVVIFGSALRGWFTLGNIPRPLLLTALGIFLYSILSLFIVLNLTSWFVRFSLLSFYITSTFVIISSRTGGGLDRLLKAINFQLAIAVVFTFLGIIRSMVWVGRYTGDFSPVILYRSSEVFIMLSYIPLAFIMYMQTRRNKYLLASMVLSVGIVLSYSRTGFVGLTVSFMLVGYILFRYFPKSRVFSKAIVAGMMLVVALGVSYYFGGYAVVQRMESINLIEQIWSGEAKVGEEGGIRKELIYLAVEAFKQSPIVGTGLGNYNEALDTANDKLMIRSHNLYISYLTELGIVGFVPLVGFIFYIIYYQWKTAVTLKDDRMRPVSLGLAAGSTPLLVMMLSQEFISAPYVWFYWGLSTAFIMAAAEGAAGGPDEDGPAPSIEKGLA